MCETVIIIITLDVFIPFKTKNVPLLAIPLNYKPHKTFSFTQMSWLYFTLCCSTFVMQQNEFNSLSTITVAWLSETTVLPSESVSIGFRWKVLAPAWSTPLVLTLFIKHSARMQHHKPTLEWCSGYILKYYSRVFRLGKGSNLWTMAVLYLAMAVTFIDSNQAIKGEIICWLVAYPTAAL